MHKEDKPRLRFAPSPTGSLHVGGARTALFNFLFARSVGGQFILRIEDTDQVRSTEQAVQQLISSLLWLGIEWDEGPRAELIDEKSSQTKIDGEKGDRGPYFQSKRLPIYKKEIEKLLRCGKAYVCKCQDEELKQKREQSASLGKPYVYDGKCRGQSSDEDIEAILSANIKNIGTVRFLVDDSMEEISFHDMVKGDVNFDSKLIGDFIIQKSDGFPTYNFAATVDDSAMGITHILRGDDHISNTPRQIMLYEALGYSLPTFCHVAMILGENREKLSKRTGGGSVEEFAIEGYYPDPLINHLALLGWSPKDGIEIIAREKLMKVFGDMKFSSAPAIFHKDKLDYLNGHFIRNMEDTYFLAESKKFLSGSLDQAKLQTYLDFEKIDELLICLRNYLKKMKDLTKYLGDFFSPPKTDSQASEWRNTDDAKKIIALCMQIFSENKEPYISEQELKGAHSKAKQNLAIGGKKFFMPLRVVWTGLNEGLELVDYIRLLKRSVLLDRMRGEY